MKVTNVIRNYVEREVAKKFEPALREVNAISNPAVKEVRDSILEMVREANERAIALAKEKGVFFGGATEEAHIKLVRFGRYGFDNYIQGPSSYEERSKRRHEICRRQRDAVEDILVAVELGDPTKRELCDLIEAIEV